MKGKGAFILWRLFNTCNWGIINQGIELVSRKYSGHNTRGWGYMQRLSLRYGWMLSFQSLTIMAYPLHFNYHNHLNRCPDWTIYLMKNGDDGHFPQGLNFRTLTADKNCAPILFRVTVVIQAPGSRDTGYISSRYAYTHHRYYMGTRRAGSYGRSNRMPMMALCAINRSSLVLVIITLSINHLRDDS